MHLIHLSFHPNGTTLKRALELRLSSPLLETALYVSLGFPTFACVGTAQDVEAD